MESEVKIKLVFKLQLLKAQIIKRISLVETIEIKYYIDLF